MKYRDKSIRRSLNVINQLRNSVVKDIKIVQIYSVYQFKELLSVYSNKNNMNQINHKVKVYYIPTLLENGKLVDNPSTIARMFHNFLLRWVKTQIRIYPIRTTVLLLFWREFSLTQCFSPLQFISIKLNPTYLKWTVRNPLVLIVFQSTLTKVLNTHVSPPLSCLINESFLRGIFPEKLKLAKVTPAFKKGSTQDKDN